MENLYLSNRRRIGTFAHVKPKSKCFGGEADDRGEGHMYVSIIELRQRFAAEFYLRVNLRRASSMADAIVHCLTLKNIFMTNLMAV